MASRRPDAGADVPVRDAATVILIRDAKTAPRVLMGQRGRTAAFMPDRYVFPGGAVDAADAEVTLPRRLGETCAERLASHNNGVTPHALAAAAIRELWEETGLRLGCAETWAPPAGWNAFALDGKAPDASALRFFFRAVTPRGRPRRFDARFFLADAGCVIGDPDDFSNAEDELSHLHWVGVDEARRLDLPFITRLVLAELEAHLPATSAPGAVPFVTNDAIDDAVVWL